MYNESTETKSNGQETLETLTTAKKEILDNLYKTKTELIAIQNLILKITIKKILDDLYKIKAELIAIQNLNLEMTKKLLDIQKIKITLIAGPMCAGKSAELIKKSHEFDRFLCYRADLSGREMDDGKDSVTEIRSRKFKESIKAIPLKQNFNAKEIIELAIENECQAIIIDEALFLILAPIKDLIHECLKAPKKIEIIFACLNMDFLGKEFSQFWYISKIAHETILLSADCSVKGCEEEATHTAKIYGDETKQIQVGDKGMYQPCCYVHWRFLNILLGNKVIINEELENKYSEKIKRLTDANSSFNENGIIEFKDGKKICFNTKSHTCYSIQSK